MRKTEKQIDRDLQRQLRQFDAVWRRVSASRSPQKAAEARGVKLMPRKCCRKRWK